MLKVNLNQSSHNEYELNSYTMRLTSICESFEGTCRPLGKFINASFSSEQSLPISHTTSCQKKRPNGLRVKRPLSGYSIYIVLACIYVWYVIVVTPLFFVQLSYWNSWLARRQCLRVSVPPSRCFHCLAMILNTPDSEIRKQKSLPQFVYCIIIRKQKQNPTKVGHSVIIAHNSNRIESNRIHPLL